MARPIDLQKMDRVKDAAIELITDKGYAATSIEMVALRAEVSTGYLYRHHPSKLSLVQAIYEQQMKALHDCLLGAIEANHKVEDVISALVNFLARLVKEKPRVFDFLFLMLHDHTFQFPSKRVETIIEICKRTYALGKKSGELNEACNAEAIFFTLFSIPFKFFDSRQRKIFLDRPISPKDLENVKRICLTALG